MQWAGKQGKAGLARQGHMPRNRESEVVVAVVGLGHLKGICDLFDAAEVAVTFPDGLVCACCCCIGLIAVAVDADCPI